MTSNINDPINQFEAERADRIAGYASDSDFQNLSWKWATEAFRKMYMYNFQSFGRPIIQFPADIIAISELIWKLRPDVIVETGIAHGGSIIHNAGQLALLDLVDAQESDEQINLSKPRRRVIAVDIDIRPHNRKAIEEHPFSNRIMMVEGSSVDHTVVQKVVDLISGAKVIFISLDSSHSHEHVLRELKAYAPMTSQGSYCLVFDTAVEYLPQDFFPNRPWGPGNSPCSAIGSFLELCQTDCLKGMDGADLNFEVDRDITNKLVLTGAPGGFLYRKPL